MHPDVKFFLLFLDLLFVSVFAVSYPDLLIKVSAINRFYVVPIFELRL